MLHPEVLLPSQKVNFQNDPKKMQVKSRENPKKVMQIIIGFDMWNFLEFYMSKFINRIFSGIFRALEIILTI